MFSSLTKKLAIDRYLRITILALAAVGIIAIVLLFFRVFGGNKYFINTNRTAVVKQLQALNRYETVSFTIEKIIDAGNSGNVFSQLLFGDKLLLIAHGQVIAGFDLSKLTGSSVHINGESITLDLPAPEVLFTTLDEGQTRVYDRSTGILTKGDKDLESKAREAAQTSIQAAACQENILDEAAKNGRNQLTALLKALGFTTVIINIPAASC
ncbi:MAG TPA: DUF4230 domain-containing protein [Patescibacteria group bacterium]|nr:DUF4230 domain-containing protein [Patescibacteria group bacterium]